MYVAWHQSCSVIFVCCLGQPTWSWTSSSWWWMLTLRTSLWNPTRLFKKYEKDTLFELWFFSTILMLPLSLSHSPPPLSFFLSFSLSLSLTRTPPPPSFPSFSLSLSLSLSFSLFLFLPILFACPHLSFSCNPLNVFSSCTCHFFFRCKTSFDLTCQKKKPFVSSRLWLTRVSVLFLQSWWSSPTNGHRSVNELKI